MTRNTKCDSPRCEISKPCIKCQKRMYKHTVTSYQKIRDYVFRTIDEECSSMAAMVLRIEVEELLKLRASIIQRSKKIQRSINEENENANYLKDKYKPEENVNKNQASHFLFGVAVGLTVGALLIWWL